MTKLAAIGAQATFELVDPLAGFDRRGAGNGVADRSFARSLVAAAVGRFAHGIDIVRLSGGRGPAARLPDRVGPPHQVPREQRVSA